MKPFRQITLALASLTLLTFANKTRAQEFLVDAGRPGKQDIKISLRQSSDLLSENEGGPNKNTTARLLEGSLTLPFYQPESSSYGVAARARHLEFDRLTTNSNFVPVTDLYRYQYGLFWATEQEDKSTWSLSANYGSASDRPFHDTDVTTIDSTLTRKYETSATTSWLLFLNYSNNRSILNNFPLPGFAYLFTDTDKTRGGAIGLPFFSYWFRPTKEFSTSLFMLFPSNAQIQAGYMIWGPLQANLKFEYGQQTYLRSGRKHKKEQIFYDTKKVAFSIKSLFGAQRFLELEMARVFDRALYEGKDAFNPISDRLRLPAEWQISATAQWIF